LANSQIKSRSGDTDESVPVFFVLVGNKTDQPPNPDENEEPRVSQKRAEEWCQRNGGIPYVEASAKDGNNVERAFHIIAERSVKEIEL